MYTIMIITVYENYTTQKTEVQNENKKTVLQNN